MKWTSGCWDFGALDHIRRDCTKAKLDIGGKVKLPQVYVSVSSISSCESSYSTHQPSKLLPVGILDSACTSPVCGSVWLSRYESLLPRGYSIARSKQRVEFSFGCDVRTSLVSAVIPIWVNGYPRNHRVSVITEVTNDPNSSYLPLLLSRACHKLLGLVVNHVHGEILVLEDRHSPPTSDSVTVVGRRVPSVVVSSHQALPLLPPAHPLARSGTSRRSWQTQFFPSMTARLCGENSPASTVSTAILQASPIFSAVPARIPLK